MANKINNMKLKFLLLIFVFSVSITISHAQRFNGGVLAGLSMAEISGDRLEGPNKAGVYAGIFVNTHISERSSFQMELDYIQKGSRKNQDSTDYSSYLLRINYVELFVNYKWDFARVFTLEAGPSLGVLIGNPYEEVDGYSGKYGPDFKRYDFSLNVGLFLTLTEHWRFNVRYSNSVLAVRPHSSGQTYRWNRGQYNEVLSFTFHYKI